MYTQQSFPKMSHTVTVFLIIVIGLIALFFAPATQAGQVLKVYEKPNQSKPVQKPSLKGVLRNYFGISNANLFYNNIEASAVNTEQILLQLGTHLSLSTAIEGRIGVIHSEETVTYGADKAKQKINSFLGLYLRHAFYQVKAVEFYGLLGLTQTESQVALVQNNLLYEQKNASTNLSYGVGMRFQLGSSPITGNLEYNRLVSQQNYDISSFNIGINFYF